MTGRSERSARALCDGADVVREAIGNQFCVRICYMFLISKCRGVSDLGVCTREIMLFIGKPRGRSRMVSNATNPLKESRKESLLRCAGSTSICLWLVCDLVVMCVQAVGDRALGDLCVCVRCGSVQGQKV